MQSHFINDKPRITKSAEALWPVYLTVQCMEAQHKAEE